MASSVIDYKKTFSYLLSLIAMAGEGLQRQEFCCYPEQASLSCSLISHTLSLLSSSSSHTVPPPPSTPTTTPSTPDLLPGLEFPWGPKPFAEVVAGPLLRNNRQTADSSSLEGHYVGVYFSAHWVREPERGVAGRVLGWGGDGVCEANYGQDGFFFLLVSVI